MSTSVKHHEVVLHFVFTPKYRLPLLVGEVARRCEQHFRQVCDELDIEIIALAIMPDHVHLLIAESRTITRAYFVQRVKGRASHHLRQEFPDLKKIKAFWGRDYFVRSVGGGRQAVRKYIESQGITAPTHQEN